MDISNDTVLGDVSTLDTENLTDNPNVQVSDPDAEKFHDMTLLGVDEEIDVNSEIIADNRFGKIAGPAQNNTALLDTTEADDESLNI